MSWRPRLIALDVDGTMVDRDNVVPDRLRRVLARALDAGVHVLPATGRSLTTTAPTAAEAGMHEWAVCSNGAILARLTPEPTVTQADTFDPTEILELLRAELPNASFAVEDLHGVFHTTQLFPASPLGDRIVEVPWSRLTEEPVVRIVMHSDEHAERGFGELAEKLGLHNVLFGVARVAWMDIGPKGVSKASMLDRLRLQLDINIADTMAFGDGDNDVEMLAWAGVGVALDVAPPALLAVADRVTSGVPGDGVALVLEEFFGA